MKSFAHALAVLITLLATSSSAGAELVLRERATQHGAVVRLGDLADISAASSTETTGLANTPLLPAPAAGTSLFLNVAQLRELLLARGIRLDQLDFRGAQVVEIGNATAPPDLEAKAMPAPPTPQEVERRVERAIERHLQDSTGGGRWRVAVLIDKRRVLDIAALADELTVRGRPQPRSGRERFFVSTANQPQELAVTADVTRIQSAVVVKRPIDRGALVRADRSSNCASRKATCPADLWQTYRKWSAKKRNEPCGPGRSFSNRTSVKPSRSNAARRSTSSCEPAVWSFAVEPWPESRGRWAT